MNLDGEVIHKWEFEFEEDMLLDYIYIDGRLYLVFISQFSQYEESIDFYCSNNEDFEWIGSMQKESYMHDMDFLHIFNKNNKVRFLIIRHNRLHLYTMDEENNNSSITIDDDYEIYTNLYHLNEIAVLEGSKWVISNGYAVNIKGKLWEIYNTDLELVCSFEFTDDLIDWLGIAVSDDGSLIAAATDCSEEEKGALAVYNNKTGQVHTHFQRYGFFSTGIAAGRVWATIASSFSDIGGLMIFDKEANLKYASLKDEESFSALDVCVFDLKKCMCDIIKVGAPAGYIKSESETSIISAQALPLGIIEDINPQVQSFVLKAGDFVVLVTDGISDAFDNTEELQNLINNAETSNPQVLADLILDKALEKTGNFAEDDMTVLVGKIWEKL